MSAPARALCAALNATPNETMSVKNVNVARARWPARDLGCGNRAPVRLHTCCMSADVLWVECAKGMARNGTRGVCEVWCLDFVAN
jgi:hypothetical protein